MADLPPTQYLVMEVLAARARTGETMWTFPTSLNAALVELERLGLITTMHGVAPASRRARLTEAGRRHSLKPDYVPPNGILLADLAADLKVVLDQRWVHNHRTPGVWDSGVPCLECTSRERLRHALEAVEW